MKSPLSELVGVGRFELPVQRLDSPQAPPSSVERKSECTVCPPWEEPLDDVRILGCAHLGEDVVCWSYNAAGHAVCGPAQVPHLPSLCGWVEYDSAASAQREFDRRAEELRAQ